MWKPLSHMWSGLHRRQTVRSYMEQYTTFLLKVNRLAIVHLPAFPAGGAEEMKATIQTL